MKNITKVLLCLGAVGVAVGSIFLFKKRASGAGGIVDSMIQSSSDDGSIEWPANVFQTLTCYVGNWWGSENTWHKFNGIFIPRGATIRQNTYLELVSMGLYPGSPATMVKTRLYFNKAANPTVPVSPIDYVNKQKTQSFTNFNPAEWIVGAIYRINARAMIQELVNAFDYSAGDSMMAMHMDNGSIHPSQIMSYDYSDNPSLVAKLHIEYS